LDEYSNPRKLSCCRVSKRAADGCAKQADGYAKVIEMAREDNESLNASEKLKRKAYENESVRLHVELVKLQEWVKGTGAKVCILFEGRDGAGKGGRSSERLLAH
jgi:polyphosphate kinase 2 (PPK2 family)